MYKGLGILLILGSLFSSTCVYAQADTAVQDKQQVIRAVKNVMSFSGGEMMKRNIEYLSAALISQKVPRDIVEQVVGNVDVKIFDEIALKVFSQHFTVEDAQAINEFYESPVGKKFSQTMPVLAREYFNQSSNSFLKIYQDIFDQLKDKGYPLDDLRKAYLSPAQASEINLPDPTSPAAMEKD